MVDGVLTRHQAALAAQTTLEGDTTTTQNPEWQREVNRIQIEMNGMETRLEKKIDDNFQEMRVALMADLQKLLEIGLGKKISAEPTISSYDGILGPQPVNQATGGGGSSQGNGNPTIAPPVIVVEDNGQKETQMGTPIQTNNFAYKLLCPRFDGEDFRGWISKLEQYFEAEKVPEFAKIRVVMLHLEGKALQWHQFLSKTQRDLNNMVWEDYLKLMRERFAPGGFSDPFSELLALKQSESVEQYYEEFINLLNQVQLPDNYVLSMFKNHLRLEISQYLELLQPQSLIDAFHMAKRVESMFCPVQKRSNWSVAKSSSPASLYVPSRMSHSGFKGIHNMGTMSAPSVASKVSTPSNLSPTKQRNIGGGSQRGPGKALSPTEIEERRKKGLCFWCAAKYTPGHKCAKTQLFQIMVDGLEDEGEQDEFLDCEDHGETVFLEGNKKEGPTMSLQAMWGASSCDTMKLQIEMGEKQLIALLDSGSTHNFISWNVVKCLGLEMERRNRLKVIVADGNSLETLGVCKGVEWRVRQQIFTTDFLVLPIKGSDVVLGIQWLVTLGAIKWNFATMEMEFLQGEKMITLKGLHPKPLEWIESRECSRLLKSTGSVYTAAIWVLKAQVELKKASNSIPMNVAHLLEEFQDVFAVPRGLPPERGQDHKIPLIDESMTIKVKPYRYPTWQKDEIEKMIKEMLEAGVIRDSNSNFSSPIVMVKKKDNSWRMCVDYRKLNQVTIKDKFPMPVIEELLDELGGARVFSKLDLRSGYHQIRMCQGDIHKTAFRTHEGHYEFMVMPFGLTNAPATFQGLMNKVFKGQLRKSVLVFFDDILVYSNDLDTHLSHLREVLGTLRAHKLYAKLNKCSFRAGEIDYLGYVISQGVISMDKSKVSSIMEWPVPTSLKELRGFLGLSGYYRRFIQGYGVIARPLTNLLKKDGWKWGSEESASFQKLKGAVSTAPVLVLPNFNEEFVVETDACEVGVGAVLTQRGKPLAFFSKALGTKHQKLSVYEKEMLAVLMAVKKWSQYLMGRHFRIKTDHQSLRFLAENQAITSAQQKWVAKMMGYDYEVSYKKGINNVVADSLSRRPIEVSCFEITVTSVSNDTLARVTDTWQQDPKLRKIIEELKDGKKKHGKYTWDGRQLRRKGKLVVGANLELRKELLLFFHARVQRELPVIGSDGAISKEPVRILERRIGKRGNRAVTEVLVEWTNSFPEDATWEVLHQLLIQFPHFNP
ncbi:hypothetical protein GQ457_10G007190 [Hibiscus cannabinus]